MINVYKNYASIDNIFLKISIILVCLVPFGMALGGLFPEIFLLLSFSFLFPNIYKNKDKYLKKKFVYFFFIFYFYILFNSVIQNLGYFENIGDYFFDQKSIIFFFRYIFYFILIWYLFDVLKTFKKIFFYSIIITISLISFDALFQYFNDVNLMGMERSNTHRLSGIFDDEYILGSYLLRIYFILLPLFLYFFELGNKKNLYIYISINLCFCIIIFLSGERSAFYLFIITLTLSFLIFKELSIKIFFQTIIVLFTAIFVLILSDSKIHQRMIYDTYDDFFNKKTKKIYFFTKIHHDHYFSAKLMFRDNFLTGIGPKMFKVECKKPKYSYFKNRCNNHPHNYYVQIFTETGFLGGIFIAFLFCIISYNFFVLLVKLNKIENWNKILAICFLILLFPIVPHGNFFNNWIILMNLLPLSLYYHFKYMPKG